MRRRALLLATTAALPTAADSSSIAGSDAPEYDCSRASRPEPSAPDSSDSVKPASYPDPPADPEDDDRLVAFVEAFEEAYRRNSLVERDGEYITYFEFFTSETWTEDAPEGAGVAGVEYVFTYREEFDGDVGIGDSAPQTAVYYVDDSVALRAHRKGRRGHSVVPDPREDGDEVACYE